MNTRAVTGNHQTEKGRGALDTRNDVNFKYEAYCFTCFVVQMSHCSFIARKNPLLVKVYCIKKQAFAAVPLNVYVNKMGCD